MTGKRWKDTPSRIEALEAFIREYQKNNHGGSPSRREMADHMETGTSVITYYLAIMENECLIEPLDRYKPRSIVLTGLKQMTIYVCPSYKCDVVSNTPGMCEDHRIPLEKRTLREI